MNNLRKNNGHFQKRIHKYDIFLNSVPALPCDFLRKGSGGMAMQVSLTQFTTFPFSKKCQTAKGQGPVMHRAKPYLYYRSMGYENPRVRPNTLQKGKETKINV